MWHLYKNKHGLFEIAFIKNGRYIVGSKQGYVNRKTCIKMMREMNYNIRGIGEKTYRAFRYQDDTGKKPVIVFVYADGAMELLYSQPPSKPYKTISR